jgi:DNA sulfur modification protein DndD
VIEKIKNLDDGKEELEKEMEKIFKKSGVNSIVEYEGKWERKRTLLNEEKNFKRNLDGKAVSPEENLRKIDLLNKEIDQLKNKKFEKYLEEEYSNLKSSTQELNEKLKILSNSIGDIEGRMKILKKDLIEEEPQIIKKIDLLDEEIQKKEKTKKLLKEFYGILKEIEYETESFLKKTIEKEGSFWFSKLTLNKYKGIEISEWKDFYIILNNNEKKEITWLSKGAQDQLYFSLRLALAQRVIGEEKNFFLILDDPFITFDRNRIKEAISILKEISKEHQIILASKDEYTKDLINEIGGNIIEIEKL